MYITNCSPLSPTKVLLDHDEFEIALVAVYRTSSYHRQFVYIQTKPEPPTGLYATSEEVIAVHVREMGYALESYGVYAGRLVTSAEHEDGWAIIDGEIVRVAGSELRIRYLSPYNLIICPQASPINSSEVDPIAEQYMNGILSGTHTVEEWAEIVDRLPRQNGVD